MANRSSAVEESAAIDFLSGGGEMGALMRSLDWSQTPIGPVESVLSAAGSVYASVTSAAGDNIFSTSSIMNSAHSNFRLKPSSPLHNEQQGALESSISRLVVAVENAQSRLADLALKASDHASQAMYPTISVAKDPISVSSASSRSKDEL